MKKHAVRVFTTLMILAISGLLTVGRAPTLASTEPALFVYRPAASTTANTLISTAVLTPTIFLPAIYRSGHTPTVQLGSTSYTAHEWAGKAIATVTLSAASEETITVEYTTADGTAQAGSDYAAASGTLRFAPGETSRTITLTINDDRLRELDETLQLMLINPVNGVLSTPHTATVTIVDDEQLPTVQLVSDSYGVNEGTGTATVTAMLGAVTEYAVTVDYATSDGTAQAGRDYTAANGTLRFAPGEVSAAIAVPLNDDPFDEPDEMFELGLRNPTHAVLGTPDTATVTIVDNDQPPTVQFSSSNYTVHEEAGTGTVIATLSAASEQVVTVDYATSDGTAQAGSDYAAANGTLRFAPGETSTTITVTINSDQLDEADETVNLSLGNPAKAVLGTPNMATLTITDNDEPMTVRLSSSSYSVHEGAGTATVLATLSAASEQVVTVDYATSDGTAQAGSDYAAASGTLRFAPGETSRSVPVTVTDDPFDEPGETFQLRLRNPTHAVLGTPDTATVTIVDNDQPPTVQFGGSSVNVHEGAGTATVMATLSAASELTVTVDYATSDGTARAGSDYATASGKLRFAPGETSQSLSIPVHDDPFEEPQEAFYVTLSSPVRATLGSPNRISVTIVNEDMPSHFGLNIQAMHEITPDLDPFSEGSVPYPQTEAELLAIYRTAYARLTTALEESGAGWARARVEWADIEPEEPVPGQPPTYRWRWHDIRLGLLAETGVRLLVTVGNAPDWAESRACGLLRSSGVDEFARFMTDMVNRYKGPPYYVKHWEIFNEPDYDGSEGSTNGGACWGEYPERYAQMLAVVYPAIKAADPEAMVIMGGLAYDRFTEYGGPFLRYFPDEVLENGGGAYMDAINFHYFRDFRAEWERWVPEGNPPTCGILDDGEGTPYEAWGIDVMAKANHFHNRMAVCHGVDKPVWLTEISEHGWPGNASSLANQARYVIQANARALAAGVEHITWYALSVYESPWEFQILYDDWTPKPAFRAYQVMTSELAGYEYVRSLNVSKVEGYVFRTLSQQEKTVAWGKDSGTLAFSPAGTLRVVDREGNEVFVDDGGAEDVDGTRNGAVALRLSIEPVFVTVAE